MATEKFKSLDEAKQRRILTAALKEFAENGYEQASTNRIVKEAGIGKGMLFYYFENKQALYHHLIDYCLNIIMNDYLKRIDVSETDFIERLKQAALVKMQASTENPDVFNFMGTLFLTKESELPADLERRIEALQRLGHAKLYDNVDTALFRDDVDVNKAYQLIRWSIEGYQKDLENRLKGQKMTDIDLDPLWEEFYEYLEILKTIFYKQKGAET